MSLHIPDIGDDDSLAAALAYAAAGWYILPVKAGTKDPGGIVGKGWPGKSSRDPKIITAWFAGTDYGIALHCGRSGAVVLDVDNPDNVPDEVLLVMESDAPYQATRTDQPGRGHYLLANGTGRRIGNSLGKLAADKKWGEVRGANGVIVVAPTAHPDGGLYRWQRTGPVPELPDYIAAALPDSATPEDTATDAQVKAFLDANSNGTLTEAISGLANTLRAKIDRGASCHMSTLGVITDAMAEAAAGLYPARQALNAFWPIYRTTVTTGTSTGRILTAKEAKDSFAGILAWAIAQAPGNAARAVERVRERIPPPEIGTLDDIETLESIEGNFWDSREHLNLIYTASLAQMASPWAVLACCAARLLALTPPTVRLPAIIGGEGSLNWFGAIVAKSGGGKGAAMAVADNLVVSDDVYTRGAGSGEGMIEAYRRATEGQEVQSILFSIDEVDSLASLKDRSGQTTMSVIRSGFSGETLGYTYRGRAKEVVPKHTYRMTMLVSVQPDRAAALFDDTGGGTPQRFQWFIGRDKRITAEPPDWPTRRGVPMRIPLLSATDMGRAAGIVSVPDEVRDTVRRVRAASMSGDDCALDGHALYCREKFAFALALIDGRTEIDDEDWKLSGVAAAVSDWTREATQRKLLAAQDQSARERGRLMGISRTASDLSGRQERAAADDRLLRWVVTRLEESDGKQATRGSLYRAAASRDRHLIDAALTHGALMGVLLTTDGAVKLK
ncbi:MAG: bifunctional DNA primase/polymerase [Mycobacterium sp.]|nr:bifunctional DNA primase/polymerase [Mycobacterium sp.]